MSAKDSLINNKKKYKLVPPDGGWSYFIGIAIIINAATSTAFVSSYGLLFKEFLQDIGVRSTYASLLPSISIICTAIASFITNPLLSFLNQRMLALVATLIFNTGVICLMFVKSVATFHICYGILQGFGSGLIYNLSCTLLNDWFVKKPFLVVSAIQSIAAVFSMVAPLFVKWSLENYGFRNTILLMSGLTMHNFIAVALMQPLQWHMIRIEVPDDSSEKLLHDKKLSEEAGSVPVIKLTKTDGNLSDPNEKFYLETENEDTNIIKKILDALVDKSLSKKFFMSCVCAGPALAIFADSTYSSILPQALITAGWFKDNVSLAMTLYTFGDLAMRVLFVALSNWLQKLGSQEIYLLGVTLGLVSRLGMLWSKSFIAMMIFIPLVGASHCAVTVLMPIVVACAVPPEKFTAALGMLMMLTGVVSLVLGTAIGAVKDLSESYGPVFYLIVSCFAIIILFWSIELCYKRNKHKRLQRREYLRQKKLNK